MMPGLKIVLDTSDTERGARQLKSDLESLGSAAVKNEKQFARLEDRMKDGLKADKAKQSMDNLQKSINLTRLETAKLKVGVGDYSGALSVMTAGSGAAVKKIALLGTVMSAVALGGVAVMGKGFLETAKTFERFETQLKTITGSSAKAEAAMSWITEFTSKTPYELDQVTDSFIKMKSYGLDAEKWMATLGNTSAAMGKGLNQSVEMFADAAVGEFERLKEFGVKASKQGDEVTFKWSENGKDMVKTAKSTQSGITNALADIFGRFDGSMDDLSKTWDGMMSNLSDKWTMFQKEVTDGGPFQAMKASLKTFLDYLDTNEGRMDLKTWAQETAQVTVESFIFMAKGLDVFLSGIRTTQALYAGFVSQIKKWNTDGLNDALDNTNAAIESGFNVELNKEIRNGLIVKIALLDKERAAWDEIGVSSLIASDKTTAGIDIVTKEMDSWLKASSDTKAEVDGLGESIDKLVNTSTSGAGAGVLSALDISEVTSFYSDYDKATLSSFEIQEKALDASYDKRLKLAESGVISRLDLDEWYFVEWLKIQDAKALKETAQIDAATKEREEAAKEEASALAEIQEMRYNMLQDLGGSDYYSEQIKAIQEYTQTYIDMSGDIVTAEAWKNQQIQKLNAETALKDIEAREDSFAQIESSLSSIAALYEEGTKQQEIASTASKAVYAAEMAMLVQRNIMIAVGAVAQQGTGDPYTAFARIAAMIAVMSSVLSIANIDFSSGGGSGSSSAQSTGLVSTSDYGTVLGDSSAVSESISNSIGFLEDIEADQYSALIDIFYEMKDLNSNITSLATSIVQDYGDFSADTMGISEGYTSTSTENFFSEAESVVGDFFNIAGDLGTAWISETVTGWVGDLVSGIFGGGKTEKLYSAGIYVGPWSASEGSPTYSKEQNVGGKYPKFYKNETGVMTEDVYVKIYDTIKTKEDGGLTGSDSTYYDTDLNDASPDTVKYVQEVLDSFVDLAKGFSDELGVSSEEEILAYTIDIGQINLKDLEGDEITDAIEGAFAEAGDTMITDLFGGAIEEYQEINEGLFETAVRLVTVKNVVTDSFDKIGISFDVTSAEAVAFSQDIIDMSGDLSDFQQNFDNFYDAFYSAAEKQANFKELADSSLKALDEGIEFPEAKESFKELVSSIDITSESGVKLYTTLMALTDGAGEYYDYLEEMKDFNKSLQSIIDGNNIDDYELSLKSLDEWYAEQSETAIDLGISLSLLTEAYTLQKAEIESTAAASRIVSLAINGQLTASEKFSEWQIKSAAALTLYSDITDGGVTQDELEGAIDAFTALGVGGNELGTIIQSLADIFSASAEELSASYEELSDAVASSRSAYSSALQAALADANSSQDALLQAMETAQSAFSNILTSTLESLNAYQSGLLTGSDSILRPDQLLAQAQSNFDSAQAGDLPEMGGILLAAAKGALTDASEYEKIFGSVQARVSGEASSISAELQALNEQTDYAQAQVILLESEAGLLGQTYGTIDEIKTAEAEYQAAKAEFDGSKWTDQIEYYEKEISRLEEITNATLSVKDSLDSYQFALMAAVQSGYNQLSTNFAKELANLREQAIPAGVGFADGGVSTGPVSGYSATLHGTEAIIPINGAEIPVIVKNSSDPELKALLRQLIAEVQKGKTVSNKVYRILDRATEGENGFLTRVDA